MPRVVVTPSVLNPTLRRVCHFDGDVEAFVRSEYPNIKNWKFQDDGETWYAVGTPGDPVTILINIAISAALSFVASKLIGKPKAPVNTTLDAASPTYSIGNLQNQARLGAAIPVIYGDVTLLPDYAAQPYVEFVNNEQYLRAIYCVGQGTVEVTKMFMGETDTVALPEVVTWRVFKPADHRQTFGTIEAATGVSENIFSNSEVADQVLEGEKPNPSSNWHWEIVRAQTPPYNDDGSIGVYVYTVEQLKSYPRPADGHEEYLFTPNPDWRLREWLVRAMPGPARHSTLTPAPGDTIGVGASINVGVGPFNMCKPLQQGADAYLDFVFAGGLFRQNTHTGALEDRSVEIKVRFEKINDKSEVIAAPVEFSHTFTAKTNTPQRYTLHFALPAGRYRCSAFRVTALATDNTISDQITWTGLKFKLVPPTHSVYGDTTLVAVSIKATNGISSEASGRVRFKCLRLLNTLDGTGLTHTRNPVDALIDILTAQYGGRRPMNAEELDLDEMRRSRTKWANHNGFNAVFDKVTTVWEAMASALQPVAAVPLPQGSRISIAHDCVKDYRVALFSDENIVAGSMQIGYEFDKVGDPEATRVEYRTPEWFDPDFVTIPPNREDVDTINLFGCTSKHVAEQHAVLANNRRKMRRKSITFETELEGLLVTHGQRIGVTHSTPKWGHSAQVVRVSGRTLTLSVAPDWTLPDLSVLIRDTEGRPHQMRGVTRGANDYELVLPSDPAFSIPTIDGGYEGAVVAIGTYNKEVTDWVVMSMEPSGEQRVKITASEYRAEVYTGTMPHQLVDGSVAP